MYPAGSERAHRDKISTPRQTRVEVGIEVEVEVESRTGLEFSWG